MPRFVTLLSTLAVAALAAAPAWAAAPEPSAKDRAFERSLAYRTGTLTVRDVRIALPHGFRYLDSADAQRTLTDLYGNSPQQDVLALILPPKSGVLDNKSFIVATYEDEGHVSDADAAKIDYDSPPRRRGSSHS